MAKSSDSYTIWYEGYSDLITELENIGEKFENLAPQISEAYQSVMAYHAVYNQLKESVGYNLSWAAQRTALLHNSLTKYLPRAMRNIARTAEEYERQARNAYHWWGGNGAVRGGFDHEGMANDFYAAAATAAAQEEADRIQHEKDEQDRIEAENQQKAEDERMQALLDALAPEAAQELRDRMTDAQYQELMEYYKDDPVMLEKIKKAYEEWKKACAERDKVLAEGGEFAEGLGLGGSDYGSDLDGGYGGGGGGGLGDLGGDWASSDWTEDLLDDNIDAEDFLSADSALDDAWGSTLDDADGFGADGADLAETGVFGQYGAQLASVVQAYGLQAALAVGGGVALYATREQTIEAAAHVAEFVSTKCKPAVNDVMEQVRGMVKKTRVNLNKASSNVKAAVRGEEAGDLIG